MLWTKNFSKIAGVILLLLVVCQLLAFFLSAGTGDQNPLEKDEIASLLTDIHDNETLYAVSGVFELAVDSVLGIAAAAVLYLLFRRRDRVLATLGLVFILGATVVFMAADSAAVALLFVADDFVNGGAEGIAPGADATLEIGRIVSLTYGITLQTASTALAAGHIVAGSLISFSPAGAGANPPRWIGWTAIIAGILIIASWLLFVSVGLFVLLIVGMIFSLIWLVLLGGWLLMFAPEDMVIA